MKLDIEFYFTCDVFEWCDRCQTNKHSGRLDPTQRERGCHHERNTSARVSLCSGDEGWLWTTISQHTNSDMMMNTGHVRRYGVVEEEKGTRQGQG